MLRLSPILVQAPDTRYPIYVGPDLLQRLPELLAEHGLTGKIAIVTNETIAPLYGASLAQRLNAALITLPDGEQYKTLDSTRRLYSAFIEAGLDRRGIVIGLGGGVIGDMAGFAAATFLRGVTFIQAPTSLLAMVDSSVGGKVGVDLPEGKNLVGAFKQPVMVVADTSLLRTLPDVEWRCGTAEIIKAGLIRDSSLLEASLYRRDSADGGANMIRQAIAIKVAIVQEDPYEDNIRAYLNLGHTFGHALETVSHYAWKHGEAVGFGLVAAARLSQVTGLCNMQLPMQVEQLVRAVGLPTRYRDFAAADIRAAMGTDKKRQGGKIRFVLLRAAGDPVVSADVPDAKVISVLESLRE